MKPERNIVAERPLANHCPELLRTDPGLKELLPLLGAFAVKLCEALAAELASLTGAKLAIEMPEAPEDCSADELLTQVGPLAANCLLTAGPRNIPVLASVEADAVLRIVDRVFGGRGEAPSPMPEVFPMSAQLMIERIETLIMNALTAALGGPESTAVQALCRDGNLAKLAPFAEDERIATVKLAVAEDDHELWHITFAIPANVLGQLLSYADSDQTADQGHRPGLDPACDPAGEVPLTLRASLVDMNIAFSKLSALEPGHILPVAVARNIPLRIDDKTIAHGTIGEQDDRVAVQITQAF